MFSSKCNIQGHWKIEQDLKVVNFYLIYIIWVNFIYIFISRDENFSVKNNQTYTYIKAYIFIDEQYNNESLKEH